MKIAEKAEANQRGETRQLLKAPCRMTRMENRKSPPTIFDRSKSSASRSRKPSSESDVSSLCSGKLLAKGWGSLALQHAGASWRAGLVYAQRFS
jgi:hypothetical protein